jgi:hypothetical protein
MALRVLSQDREADGPLSRFRSTRRRLRGKLRQNLGAPIAHAFLGQFIAFDVGEVAAFDWSANCAKS